MTQIEMELAGTTAFIDIVGSSVEALRIYPRLNAYVDRVLLTILLRCVRTARGVCTIAKQGLGDEAFIVSRTVLELCLNAYFISNTDCEARAKRFLEYFGKDREHLTKLIDLYQPSAAGSYSPDHEDLMAMAVQFKNAHKWTDKGLAEMAREPIQWADNDPVPPTKYWYDVIYRFLSHECHGTCVAAHPDLMEINYSATGCYDPFSFWDSKSSEQNGAKAVLHAYLFTAECVRYVLHGLGMQVPDDIKTARKDVAQIFQLPAPPPV
jgi:hypothetical protein